MPPEDNPADDVMAGECDCGHWEMKDDAHRCDDCGDVFCHECWKTHSCRFDD